MATYAEFLKANGATDDEVKLLDVPAARKAYDIQVKAAADAERARADAEAKATDAAAKIAAYDKWYTEVAEPTAADLKAKHDVAVAEAAAERARTKALQEAGLLKLEEKTTAAATSSTAADAFDPKKYNLVTGDILRAVADKEGEAIAVMADIAEEHRELTGTRINARELRKEALAAGKSVEEHWMQKYGIAALREKKAAESKSAYEKKIAEDAVAKYRSEHENPLTRPGAPSSNPWTNTAAKKTGTDNVIPWQGNLDQRSNDRVNKALQNLQQKNII